MTERLRRDPLGDAERTLLLEEGLSIARHDLRNHLATVRNAAFYLRRKMSQTDAWQGDARIPRFFDIIEEEIESAQTVVDERTLSARLFRRDAAPVDAFACVRDAIAWSRAPGEVPIVTAGAAAGPLPIVGDQRELSLAIRCLVENAVEASPPGAAVTVHTAVHDRRVVVTVRDQGPGIPVEEIDRVAERFFTTKRGHDGLGLNIVLRIARRYAGTLTIHAREAAGAGSSVELAFPLREEEPVDA